VLALAFDVLYNWVSRSLAPRGYAPRADRQGAVTIHGKALCCLGRPLGWLAHFNQTAPNLGVLFPVKNHQEATPGQPRLLTIAGAAQYLSTTVWQIRTLGWERRIPIIKLGNRYLFDRADLDRFIENQKTRMAVR